MSATATQAPIEEAAPAWAIALSEQISALRADLNLGAANAGIRPVITSVEVNALVGVNSDSARQRWINEWAPKAYVGNARYNYVAIRRGLEAEARSTFTRKPAKKKKKKDATPFPPKQ